MSEEWKPACAILYSSPRVATKPAQARMTPPLTHIHTFSRPGVGWRTEAPGWPPSPHRPASRLLRHRLPSRRDRPPRCRCNRRCNRRFHAMTPGGLHAGVGGVACAGVRSGKRSGGNQGRLREKRESTCLWLTEGEKGGFMRTPPGGEKAGICMPHGGKEVHRRLGPHLHH